MVNAMPASEFLRYSRAGQMLYARQQLSNIEASSFHAIGKQSDQDKVIRNLKSQSDRWLWQPLKDFKEVAANLAKRMTDGR